MGRSRRRLTLVARLALLASPVTHADEPPRGASEALASIESFSFTYAQPGFYEIVRRVRSGADAQSAPLRVDDWRVFLERDPELRGQRVEIEGAVERNTAWRSLDPAQSDLGPLWEMQVRGVDQPIICKVILTGDAGDVPLHAQVRCAGFYVMIQQYYSASNTLRQAAIIVAANPLEVSTKAAAVRPPEGWRGLAPLAAMGAGLLIAFILLRWRGRRKMDARPAPAPRPAPFSVADDLAMWAREQEEDAPPERREP